MTWTTRWGMAAAVAVVVGASGKSLRLFCRDDERTHGVTLWRRRCEPVCGS